MTGIRPVVFLIASWLAASACWAQYPAPIYPSFPEPTPVGPVEHSPFDLEFGRALLDLSDFSSPVLPLAEQFGLATEVSREGGWDAEMLPAPSGISAPSAEASAGTVAAAPAATGANVEITSNGPPASTSILPQSEAGPVVEIPKPEKPAPKIWEGRVEFGLNGSEGNSQRLATRYGGKLKRTTPHNLLTIDLLYSNSFANGKRNESKALLDSKSEWPLNGTPWYAYTRSFVEFDEFTAFDVRLTGDAGVGYAFIKSESTTFKTRIGLGASNEIGGPNDALVPEGTSGLTFEYQLNKRQKVIANGDMFHDLSDLDDFRARSNASWEIKIDPEARLSLRLGGINRYDSTPNGRKKNDLDFSTLVVWEF